MNPRARSESVRVLWLLALAIALAAPALQAGFWEPAELAQVNRDVEAASGRSMGLGQWQAALRRGNLASLARSPGAPAVAAATDFTARGFAAWWQRPSHEQAAALTAGTPRNEPRPPWARQLRWPLFAMGLLCLALTYLVGRVALSPTTAFAAALVVAGCPLWAIQLRQLAGDLATPCAQLVYLLGLVLATCGGDAAAGRSLARRMAGSALCGLGLVTALWTGGSLLGAFPLLAATLMFLGSDLKARPRHGWALALTTAALVALVAVTLLQTHELRPPTPGERALFGMSIVPSGHESSWLGGVWKSQTSSASAFSSSFEHVFFGMWPWSALLPAVALLALHRQASAVSRLLAAHVVCSWLAMTLWQRHVGPEVVFSAWPSAGLLIASLLTDSQRRWPWAIAITAVATLAALGKDAWVSHDEFLQLTAAATKGPQAYVIAPHLAAGMRAWLLTAGGLVLLVVTSPWLPQRLAPAWRRVPLWSVAASCTLIAAGTHWYFYPRADQTLSSAALFRTARALRPSDSDLVQYSDLGRAAAYYDDRPWRRVTSLQEVASALGSQRPALALAHRERDLCALHRLMKGRPYHVLDNGHATNVLLGNRSFGVRDLNPIGQVMHRQEPAELSSSSVTRPPGPVVFDGKIELVGWRLPARVHRGAPFEVTLYFKVRAPVGGAWKVFGHYDGPNRARFGSDHAPACGTQHWDAGDWIVDRYTVTSHRGVTNGTYALWTGFFTGTNPSFRNMQVTEAPAGWNDKDHRVRIATLQVQ